MARKEWIADRVPGSLGEVLACVQEYAARRPGLDAEVAALAGADSTPQGVARSLRVVMALLALAPPEEVGARLGCGPGEVLGIARAFCSEGLRGVKLRAFGCMDDVPVDGLDDVVRIVVRALCETVPTKVDGCGRHWTPDALAKRLNMKRAFVGAVWDLAGLSAADTGCALGYGPSLCEQIERIGVETMGAVGAKGKSGWGEIGVVETTEADWMALVEDVRSGVLVDIAAPAHNLTSAQVDDRMRWDAGFRQLIQKAVAQKQGSVQKMLFGQIEAGVFTERDVTVTTGTKAGRDGPIEFGETRDRSRTIQVNPRYIEMLMKAELPQYYRDQFENGADGDIKFEVKIPSHFSAARLGQGMSDEAMRMIEDRAQTHRAIEEKVRLNLPLDESEVADGAEV